MSHEYFLLQTAKVEKLWTTHLYRGWGRVYTNDYNMENIKVGKVIKVGSSLAVVVPAQLARAMNLERGDQIVYAIFSKNQFVVRRLTDEELRAMKPYDTQI